MGFFRGKTVKSNKKRRKSKQFSFEPLEAKEMLNIDYGACGCNSEQAEGTSTASSMTAPAFSFNADTIPGSQHSGKVATQFFTDVEDSAYAKVYLKLEGETTWTLKEDNVDLTQFSDEDTFYASALAPPQDISTDAANRITELGFQLKVGFYDNQDSLLSEQQQGGGNLDQVRLVNRTNSLFGQGWSNESYQFIVDDGTDAIWSRGQNETANFSSGSTSGSSTPEVPGTLTLESGTGQYVYEDGFGLQLRFDRLDSTSPIYLLGTRQDAEGNVTTYQYTGEELTSVTDARGRVTTYAYETISGLRRLESMTDFAGRVTSFEYYESGPQLGFLKSISLPTVNDENGSPVSPKTEYTYTTEGKLETETNANQDVKTYIYDANARLEATINFDGSVTRLDPGFAKGLGTAVAASALSQVNGNNAESVSIDERGYSSTSALTLYGNVYEEVDAFGNSIEVERDANDLVTGSTHYVTVDGELNPVAATSTVLPGERPAFGGGTETNRFVLGEEVHPALSGQGTVSKFYTDFTDFWKPQRIIDEVGDETRLTYFDVSVDTDDDGIVDTVRESSLIASRSVVMGDEYDENQNATETDDLKTVYTYTDGTTALPAGLMLSMTDPNGNTTNYEYYDDATNTFTFGRTHKIIHPKLDGQLEVDRAETIFEYEKTTSSTTDPGTKITITDELLRKSEYHYDALDRLVQVLQPDPSAPVGDPPTTETLYTYDANGNLKSKVDAEGRETKYDYDGLNRLTKLTEADPDGVTGTEYDSPVTTYSYDAAGNFQSVVDPEGRMTSYQYDALNRRIATIEADPDGIRTAPHQNPAGRYDVNADGQVNLEDGNLLFSGLSQFTIQSLAEDELPIYQLDLHGGVQDPANPSSVVTTDTVLYLDVDGDGDFDGADFTEWYTPTFVGSIYSNPIGGDLNDIHPVSLYAYDSSGQLLSATDARGNTTTYGYDIRGRLVREESAAVINAAGASDTAVTQYTYDGVGRIQSMTDPLGRVTDYQYDQAGRLTAELMPRVEGTASNWQNELNPFDVVQSPGDPVGLVNQADIDTVIAWSDGSQFGQSGPLAENSSTPGNGYIVPTFRFADEPYIDVNADGFIDNKDVNAVSNYVNSGVVDSGVFDDRPVNRFVYDAGGRQVFSVDSMFNVTEYQYDERDRLTFMIGEDPDGKSASDPASLADPAAVSGVRPVTEYQYDAAGRRTKMIDPLSFETTYDYDELDRIEFMTLPDADGSSTTTGDQPVYEYGYDLVGNLTSTVAPTGGTTTNYYDALNRLWKVVDPIVVEATDPTDSSTQAPRTPTTTYHFDASGLMTLTVDPEGGETAFEYDRLGRLTQQIMADPVTGEAIDTATGLPHVNSPYTLYEYDPVGNRVRSQDAQGVAGSYWQEWTFDALNRETHAYSKEDVAGVTDSSLTYYQYDLVGNRALLRDPSLNETEWTYNGLDLPDFEQNQQNETRLFEYDLVGNQVQREDRLGRTTGYSYDSLHRQTEEVWYGDMPVNQAPQVLRTFVFEYDLNGRLTDSTDTDAYDYSFDHDNLNRVTDWDYSDLGGLNQYVGLIEMDFDYDLNGNQTIVDATIGGTMDYRNIMSYDYMDRLTSIMQIESDITGSMGGNIIHDKLVEFGYDLTGQFDYITTYNGSSTSSNVISQTDFTFDKTGRLAAKDHFDGNSIHTDDLINGYHYTFDTANRVTSMAVQNPLHSDESVMDYDYNYRDELTFVDYNDDDFNESYEYDENGNRISADNEFGDHDYNSSTSGTYDNNELTGDGMYTYTYDKEGNRLTRTVTTAYASDVDYIPYTEYDWDHRNRLTSVSEYDDTSKTNTLEVVDYTYDDANQLLSRVLDKAGVVSTRYFVHQNGQIVLQFDGSATSAALSHRYIWGPQVDQQLADERVESTSEEGRVLWAFTDHLGTVRDVAEYSDYTTINGTVVWKHRRYDAFGNVQHTIDRGDLNGDTDIDVEDLELLFYAIDNNVFETYDEDGNIVGINDLNGDGYLDELDIQIWVEDVIDSLMGDANLDGTVDGQDFQTWNDNKHTSDPDYEYAEADFNNDGHVNGQDFVIWNNNKFTSAGALNTDTFDYIFGFTGRMLDEATGLQNNLNRWYDAKVGRWISEDPIGFAAGDANVYRYVGNSPTNFIDPSGLSGGPVWYKPWTWGNKPKPKKTIKYSPFKKGTDKVEELATKYFKSACDIKSKRQRLLWVEGIKPKSENQAKAKEIVWQMVNDMPN